jgi:hypothetical protein
MPADRGDGRGLPMSTGELSRHYRACQKAVVDRWRRCTLYRLRETPRKDRGYQRWWHGNMVTWRHGAPSARYMALAGRANVTRCLCSARLRCVVGGRVWAREGGDQAACARGVAAFAKTEDGPGPVVSGQYSSQQPVVSGRVVRGQAYQSAISRRPVVPSLLSLGGPRKEGTRDTGEASAGPKPRNHHDTFFARPSCQCHPPHLHLDKLAASYCVNVIRVMQFALAHGRAWCLQSSRTWCIHTGLHGHGHAYLPMPMVQLACYSCDRMDRSGTLGQRNRQRCNLGTLKHVRAHPDASRRLV